MHSLGTVTLCIRHIDIVVLHHNYDGDDVIVDLVEFLTFRHRRGRQEGSSGNTLTRSGHMLLLLLIIIVSYSLFVISIDMILY